jgi:hypothetical protein
MCRVLESPLEAIRVPVLHGTKLKSCHELPD